MPAASSAEVHARGNQPDTRPVSINNAPSNTASPSAQGQRRVRSSNAARRGNSSSSGARPPARRAGSNGSPTNTENRRTHQAVVPATILLDSGACDRALVLAVEIFEECADLYARAPRLTGRPLVEAAGCLWLEPGRGRLVFESRRGGRRRARALRGDGGEMFGCEPLAALDRWRRGGASAPLELAGAWRGEQARLVWAEEVLG